MQEYFNSLADKATAALVGDEVVTVNFSGENSDFVRFSKSSVRQAGSVTQRAVSIDLIEGAKHCSGSIGLTGTLDDDVAKIASLMSDLREKRTLLPDDPYLLYNDQISSTESVSAGKVPEGGDAIDQIQDAGKGRDLVGIYASGDIFGGFANSLGQRNWHSSRNFNLDWSFYHQADKAVKSGYAGFDWDANDFGRKVDTAVEQLGVLGTASKTIEPGRYPVYLSPAALVEIIDMMSWGGFGLKSHRTKQTPLLKMVTEGATLADGITLVENTGEGVAPNFQSSGFLKPDQVTLIDGGAYKDCLVSPRSAKEYDVSTNGASDSESPESVDLAGGSVAVDSVLSEIGTGVYVGNLWYLNFSDRTACRTTGMTRFATFWVENGKIVAPLNVMRFDETAYRMLGENLIGLTAEREMILDADTYFHRKTSSYRLPGALINDFTFTL